MRYTSMILKIGWHKSPNRQHSSRSGYMWGALLNIPRLVMSGSITTDAIATLVAVAFPTWGARQFSVFIAMQMSVLADEADEDPQFGCFCHLCCHFHSSR